MTRLWQAISIGTLGVAAYEWLRFFEWFVGELTFARKTAGHGLLLVTGAGPVVSYLVLTVVLSAASILAARRLREPAPSFARSGRFATYMLLGLGVLWIGLVASPFVALASPYAA